MAAVWQTPKTDWTGTTTSSGEYVGDRFNATDFNRIKNNLDYLRELAIKSKLMNSGLKIAAFICGLTLLCLAITTLPLFADMVGWAIPEEYAEIFSDLVIIAAVLMVSCKYIVEAFTKFKAILDFQKEEIDNG